MEHDTNELGKIKNNIDINLDMSRLSGVNKNIDIKYNAGGLDKVDKNIDIKYNMSETNNTPDVDKVNNVEKEIKVCKSNLF